MYPAGEYDLAGFAVGVVEKSRDHRRPHDRAPATWCSAWRRSGAHSNGYSLVRRIIERAAASTLSARTSHGRTLARRAARADAHLREAGARADAATCRSRAWRTSPAAAWSTTCRACCRDGAGRANCDRRRLAAAAAVPLAAAAGQRRRRRNAPRVQLRHRHGAWSSPSAMPAARRRCSRAPASRLAHRHRRAAHARRGADRRATCTRREPS